MQRLNRHTLEQIIALDDRALMISDGRKPDQPIVYVNPAFESLTGFSSAEALGRNWRFLHGEETDNGTIKMIEDACASGQATAVETVSYRKDGTSFQTAFNWEPLTDNRNRVRYYLARLTPLHSHSPADQTKPGSRAERSEQKGLLDQETFIEYCERDFGITRRANQTLAVLVFRLQYFELYRETFGKTAAESCMRMVSGRIVGGLRRAGDLCTRWDDDTVAALIVGQDGDEAEALAQDLAEQVASMALKHPRAARRVVTVSTGVCAGIPTEDDSPASFIARAGDMLSIRPRRQVG